MEEGEEKEEKEKDVVAVVMAAASAAVSEARLPISVRLKLLPRLYVSSMNSWPIKEGWRWRKDRLEAGGVVGWSVEEVDEDDDDDDVTYNDAVSESTVRELRVAVPCGGVRRKMI